MADLDRPTLWHLVGVPGGPKGKSALSVAATVQDQGFARHAIAIERSGHALSGTLLLPEPSTTALPAVLYCHAHGNRHEIGASELMQGRPALQAPPYGPVLAQNGYAVLCIDMPGFGVRQKESSESALAKAALWRGKTMFGQMLAELSAALDALCALKQIDQTRIATLGISMGATHAYWLAALDERIAACAHMCAFSNIAALIHSGAHDLHGHYMSVPGLLEHGDMADVASLIAPRPQLIASGTDDPLTPPEALEPALGTVQQAYKARDALDRLTTLTSPGTGHVETPAMRRAVLAFLQQALNARHA